MARAAARHALAIRDLHVYYGASHALQGVNITLSEGVHAILGRNGMGKTTLCNAIMGMKGVASGSIKFGGKELTGLPPHKIASMGVGYTPQGRRLWRSLTVDEHLRLCERRNSAWTVERVYTQFPRLAERRRNGGAQLSGGEQQLLAISRALLADPDLLILDEPTEGLAPVIVEQVITLLKTLAAEGGCAILLVEQNIKVATSVAEDVAIMVNGRISQVLPAAHLAEDRALQQQLLGVGRADGVGADDPPRPQEAEADTVAGDHEGMQPVEADDAVEAPPSATDHGGSAYQPPERWSGAHWAENRIAVPVQPLFRQRAQPRGDQSGAVLVAGTFDTKKAELGFLRDRLRETGVSVRTVDLSTSRKPSAADVPPHVIAAHHPRGIAGVFTGDRGSAVAAMTDAFERWIRTQDNLGGIISAAGSGGTALVSPAMRALPIGVPKVMVSTVASGDVGPYVGPSDMLMMYSVTDVAGLNRISRKVLGNAAAAMSGMVKSHSKQAPADDGRPLIGLTMFGVTTTAITHVTERLGASWEPLVFHATGTGGQSMEKLADSGLLAAAMDLTTTEVCDLLIGGVFAATEDRFGSFIRTRTPWVGSVGALDMVNFHARNSVPERFEGRLFYEHNPQVTLMRTTPEENERIARFITERVNQMDGPVRFLIPEGGVSALDAPGQPFDDPAARDALFSTIAATFKETPNRRLIRVPHHINAPEFADAAVAALTAIIPQKRTETAHAAL